MTKFLYDRKPGAAVERAYLLNNDDEAQLAVDTATCIAAGESVERTYSGTDHRGFPVSITVQILSDGRHRVLEALPHSLKTSDG